MPFYSHYFNILYMIEDYRYHDDYWYLKYFLFSIKTIFGLEKLKNTPTLYFVYLRESFNREQYVTTTVVPLGDEGKNDLTIKNHQVNMFLIIK